MLGEIFGYLRRILPHHPCVRDYKLGVFLYAELVYRMISVSPVGCISVSLTRGTPIAVTLMLTRGCLFFKTFAA